MSPDPVLAGDPPDFSKAGEIVRAALGGASAGAGSGTEISPAFFDLVRDLKSTKGLAGTDAYAHEWNNQFYRPALIGDSGGAGKGGGLMDAATAALNAMGMVSDLLCFSGVNHAVGDDPDAPAFPPGTHATIPVPFIPDAQGRTAEAAPGWWPVIAMMLTGQEYPDGDVAALRGVGDRYRSVANAFRNKASALDQAADLVRQQQAPEVEGVVNWLGIVKAQILDVADGFTVLGDGCSQFADHVEKAREEVNQKAREELGNIAETEAISAALAGVTVGISELFGNYRVYNRAKELAEFVKTRLSVERISQELHNTFSPMAAVAGGPAVQGINKLMPLLNAAPAIYMPAGTAEAASVGAAIGLDRLVTKTNYRPDLDKWFLEQVRGRAETQTGLDGRMYIESGADDRILIPPDGTYPPQITSLPKTADGRYYQGTDGHLYPVDTRMVVGHDFGEEAWRLRDMAMSQHPPWTMRQLKEYLQQDPGRFRIEDWYGNASHKYEMPREAPK